MESKFGVRRTISMGLIGVTLLAGLSVLPVTAAVAAEPETIHALVNQARIDNGQAGLVRNAAMDKVALDWANTMAATGSMSHNLQFASQIPAGWTRAGENVAFGQRSAEEVHQKWMASDGHRANILGDFTDVGIAFVRARNTTWSVEVFAKYPGFRPVVPTSAATSFVTALYADVLGRSASATEQQGWVTSLQYGTSPVAVGAGFVNSDEYRLTRIAASYSTILGRSGESAGITSWLNGMRRGVLGPDDLDKAFLASDEYYNRSGQTDTSFVNAIYARLLARSPDQAGLNHWLRETQQRGRASVIDAIWRSDETARQRVSLMYQAYLGRVPDGPGLNGWATVAIQQGDGAVRWSIIGSAEYWQKAGTRFPNG